MSRVRRPGTCITYADGRGIGFCGGGEDRFRLYALDSPLGGLGQPTGARLLAAIDGHLIEMAELIGTYRRR